MTEKSWKPKRVSGDSSASQTDVVLVELSIQSAACKKALQDILGAIEHVEVKTAQGAEPPSVIVLELDENPEQTFRVIQEMTKVSNGTEIFLTAEKLDSGVLLEAIRAGAKEFLAQPIKQEEVEGAFSRYFDRRKANHSSKDDQKKSGKIFAFFGGKGGVGTTSIAVNLASALMKLPSNPSVVLVDVNQHGGDLPLYLDLQPNHSFRDIASDLSRLDNAFLLKILTKYESGLQVLSSGYDDLSTGRLNPDCVEQTLRLLQTNFDYIVLDCGHVLDLTTKKALEVADLIFVTSVLMIPVVHRTKRILELLRGSGFPPAKIKMIMNRYLSAEQDVLKETEEILKQKTQWLFPNDYPSVSQSVNSGKPIIDIASRSSIAKSYTDFARSLDDRHQEVVKSGSFASWLNPFKGRKVQPSVSEA